MYFDIKKLLERSKAIKRIRLISEKRVNLDKVEIKGVCCCDGKRGEDIQEGILYVLPGNLTGEEEWLQDFENSGCAGIIFTVAKKEEYIKGRVDWDFLAVEVLTELSPGKFCETVSNLIIQECQEIYEDLVDTNRYLFSNTLNKQDVGEMLEYFKKMVGNPVAVFDGMFHCLLTTDEILMNVDQPRTLPKTIYTGSKYLNRHFVKQRVSLNIDGIDREISMISFPISFQGKIRAYLSIPQIYQQIENLDFPKIEMTASAIMGQLKHDFALHMAEERNIDSFFYNVIYRKDMETEELERQARLLGLKTENRAAAIMIQAECEKELEEAPRTINNMFRYSLEDKMFLIISSNIQKAGLRGVTGLIDGKIMAVCEMELPEDVCLKRIKECCFNIREEFCQYFQKSILQVGIGNIVPFSRLEESCKNGEKALSYGMLVYGKHNNFVVSYQDSLLLHLVGSIKSKEELESLIPSGLLALEEYDRKHNSNLINTLSVYFEHNCNMKKGAESMTIHYKTMVYRMNQISELCKTDFSDSDIRLQYALGMKIFCLLRN